jgi:Carboxypeptidase regulatory-like domain
MTRLNFALIILVMPFAFHSIQAQPGETKPETATVSGRVTLKGEPARDVIVILRHPIPPNSPRATTDENGRFLFTGVAAGRYWISALAPGYTSPDYPDSGGKMLDISEGDKLENFDLELKRGGMAPSRATSTLFT